MATNLVKALILLTTTISTLSIPTPATTTTNTFSQPASPKTIGLLTREKQTHLHFYFHDTVLAPPAPTAYVLNMDTVLFGVLVMADDPLTVDPDAGSAVVGRAQGLYGSASLSEPAAVMLLNFAFTEGEYNGSTLGLYGRNAVLTDVREMAIVGGTGVFRFAKGFAEARTYFFDTVTLNAVVEYDVYVTHYY
ncbi:Pterocarpan synthase 1 [Linum grandiflorum]